MQISGNRYPKPLIVKSTT